MHACVLSNSTEPLQDKLKFINCTLARTDLSNENKTYPIEEVGFTDLCADAFTNNFLSANIKIKTAILQRLSISLFFQCAKEFNFNATSINTCANGTLGTQLLVENGKASHAYNYTTVPAVVFDNVKLYIFYV